MVAMANLNLPVSAVRQQISNGIQVVIQVSRMSDGSRKIMSISEVVGMEGEVITMQELFSFERQGLDEEGNVRGRFRPTGIRPKFADTLQARGVEVAGSLFMDRPVLQEDDDVEYSAREAGGWS